MKLNTDFVLNHPIYSMSRKANNPVNQYLFFLIKELVRYNQKGSFHEKLTKDNYSTIADSTGSQLTVSTLVKMYTDPTRYKWGNELLNYLSIALPKNCPYRNNYKLLVEKESSYFLCEAVNNKTFYDIDKQLLREIKKKVTRRVIEILSDEIEPHRKNIPIEYLDKDILSNINVATDEDVNQIYLFAWNRYGDCDLNPPSIKLPWKSINEKIFHVVHNADGEVRANINLLPLRDSCYHNLKKGRIEEKDILPEDIVPLTKRDNVKFIYVEGLNCQTKEHLSTFGENLHRMICTLAHPENNLLIGAIGGTPEGEKLMLRLGFEITGKYKKEDYDFFEVSYKKLYWEISKIRSCTF